MFCSIVDERILFLPWSHIYVTSRFFLIIVSNLTSMPYLSCTGSIRGHQTLLAERDTILSHASLPYLFSTQSLSCFSTSDCRTAFPAPLPVPLDSSVFICSSVISPSQFFFIRILLRQGRGRLGFPWLMSTVYLSSAIPHLTPVELDFLSFHLPLTQYQSLKPKFSKDHWE